MLILHIMFITIFSTILTLGFMILLLSAGTFIANKSLKGSCGQECECTLTNRRNCPVNNTDITL